MEFVDQAGAEQGSVEPAAGFGHDAVCIRSSRIFRRARSRSTFPVPVTRYGTPSPRW